MKEILFGLILLGSCSSVLAQSLLVAAKEKGKKYGYIDVTGNYVIQPRYDEALAFNEGYAVVKVGDKYGVIDTNGAYVITPRFDMARDMVTQGKLSVWSNEYQGWGSIRMDTSMLIDYSVQYLSSYHKGYVISAEYEGDSRMSITVFDSLGQMAYTSGYIEGSRIGKKNKEMTVTAIYEPKVRYGRIQTISPEGPLTYGLTTLNSFPLSVDATNQSVYREGLVVGQSSGGMIPYYKPGDDINSAEYDSTDRRIEPIAFLVRGEVGYPFFNGIAAIEQDGVWAFIDREGKVVSRTTLPAKDYTARPPMYIGGLVGLFKGSKAGYINLKGEVVISFQLSEYHPFEYDVTPVQKGGKYGLLKKDGTWAVEPKFENLNLGPCPCFR
jgi:hypothetical protein